MKSLIFAAASCLLLASCGEKKEAPVAAAPAAAASAGKSTGDQLSLIAFSQRRAVFRVNGEPVKGSANESTFPMVTGYPLKQGRNEVLIERFVDAKEEERIGAATLSGKTEAEVELKQEGERNLRGEFELGSTAPPPGTGIPGEWSPGDKDKLLDWSVALFAAMKAKDEGAIRGLFDVALERPPVEWTFFLDPSVQDFNAVPKAKMDWVAGKSMVLVLADPADESARLATAKNDKADFWIDSIPFFRDSAGDVFVKGLENNWTKLKLD